MISYLVFPCDQRPTVEIMVRGDRHYAAAEAADLLEEKRCDSILSLPANASAMRRALSKKVRRFHQATYRAGWWKVRKIIARAEATSMQELAKINASAAGTIKIFRTSRSRDAEMACLRGAS